MPGHGSHAPLCGVQHIYGNELGISQTTPRDSPHASKNSSLNSSNVLYCCQTSVIRNRFSLYLLRNLGLAKKDLGLPQNTTQLSSTVAVWNC